MMTDLSLLFRNDALRRPRNYFLINLAVTDIGLLLTNNSMHVIASFRKGWVFGQRGNVLIQNHLTNSSSSDGEGLSTTDLRHWTSLSNTVMTCLSILPM